MREKIARGTRRPAVVLGVWLAITGTAWTLAQPLDAVAVAERLLASERGRQGDLALRARLEERLGAEPSEAGRLPVRLEALLPLDGEDPRRLRLSLVIAVLEGESELWQQERTVAASAGERRWLLRAAVELPEDFAEAVLVVEDLGDGRWAAVRAELDGAPWEAASGGDVLVDEVADPVVEVAATPAAPVVRLVPPRDRPATGRVRLHALPASDEIARVVFLLDGREAAADGGEPYSQVVDLGKEPVPHELAVVAFAADGAELGRDARRVNTPGRPFDVAVAAQERGGSWFAVADVTVPPERRLAAVELYRYEEQSSPDAPPGLAAVHGNEVLLTTLTEPPFEVALPAPEGGLVGYVRALVRLDDGTSLDDVAIVGEGTIGEKLEVNLVQVFAVVTDRSGAPVRDLDVDDFTLNGSGKEVAIERFAFADDLPLTLGVVFDSSESMWSLMTEAKQAGATFLAHTLRSGDRAFLVDFDTRPRLAQPMTEDVREVLMAFGRLRAGGYTALYDAILYGMLQFEAGPGRKALLVLTDGEDYGSELSGARCAELGRRLGVPVYIVDLSGIVDPWTAVPSLELEAVADPTGGRVYVVSDLAHLAAKYDEIRDELRSQYLLAFSTDRLLSEKELTDLDVEVKGRGLRVRRVVGATGG